MKSRISFVYVILIFCWLVTITNSCSGSDEGIAEKQARIAIPYDLNITDNLSDVFYPIYSGRLPVDTAKVNLKYQKNGKDYENYFSTICIALEFLQNRDSLFTTSNNIFATNILDKMERTFDNHGCFPRPGYHQYKDGWVSSMDAPLIAVTALVAFEKTNNKKYYNFYEKLIPYLVLRVDEHGFLLEYTNGDIFPLEYCDTGSTKENSMFVLNGSLVGYLSLAVLEKHYGTPGIKEIIEKIDNSYKKKFPDFIRADRLWTFYMLNKLISNQGHYHIFEMRLFNSLYKVTGNEMFQFEFETRKNMLSEIYDLKILDKGDSLEYYFLRSAAPQPYMVELYGTILRFYDSENNVILEDANPKTGHFELEEFESNAILMGTLPKTVVKYQLISVISEKEVVLLEDKVNDFVVDRGIKKHGYKLHLYGDVQDNSNEIEIVKGLSETEWANISLTCDSTLILDYKKYYFLEINGGIDGLIMQLILYDSAKNNLERYIPRMINGKNLVLFSPLGFHSKNVLSNIETVLLKVHTETEKCPKKFQISIGDFGELDNEYEVIKYLEKSDFKVNSK